MGWPLGLKLKSIIDFSFFLYYSGIQMKIGICAELNKNTASEKKFNANIFNGELQKNIAVIKSCAEKASAKNADLIMFGEAFLQGFDSLTFDYNRDINVAVFQRGKEISEIRDVVRKNKVAVGFGYLENAKGIIYSSYIILDSEGNTVYNYRRVSVGWRIRNACADYREGTSFGTFTLGGKKFTVVLCGDFWEDHLIPEIIKFDNKTDIFLWPVHCDYNIKEWEEAIKKEYAEHSAILDKPVLFCNNYCIEEGQAKGGAYCWHHGKTLYELPAGKNGMLIAEL
ncbi:MAG: carbon-nitrogen hydrolase family protein [Treponema sp.]|nr:MAG: carbon-nitrogen hydrolase family protein [Treponema sp.]